MISSMRRNLLLWIKPNSDPTATVHLCYHQNPFSKFISSSSFAAGDSSRTELYLIESCGLPPKSALAVAQKLPLRSTRKPDSVLAFLKVHGFTATQIAKAIVKMPKLLTMHPEKVFKPKLEFIYSLGLSNPDLPEILSSVPSVFSHSLERKLIPNLKFFKEILQSDAHVITALKSSALLLLTCDLQKTVVPNIEILRNSGLPESSISKLITTQPKAVIMRRPDQFNEAIEALKEMGFKLSSPMFVYGMRAMLGLSKPSWERKFDFFRSLGLSDSEIFVVFGKIPLSMTLSDDKIRRHMDFLVNTLKLKPAMAAAYPGLITRSLDRTIIPRCAVLNILMLNGKIQKDLILGVALTYAKPHFLKRFVTKYQEEFPELLDAYEGKIAFVGFKNGLDI